MLTCTVREDQVIDLIFLIATACYIIIWTIAFQAIKLLKEKCELKLQVERNLENDLSHDAPDFNITGALSSVHCSLDVTQYKLVRGLLNHNLGEQLEEFKLPMFSHLQDPKIQVV